MGYEEYLMRHYLTINGLVAALSLVALLYLARKLPAGWAWGIAGFFPAFVLTICAAAVVVAGYLVQFPNGNLLGAALSDPSTAISFLLQSGIEFGLVGMVIGLIGYPFGRRRSKS